MITRNDGMWATIRCPKCGLHYKVLNDKAHWQQHCPYCSEIIDLSKNGIETAAAEG